MEKRKGLYPPNAHSFMTSFFFIFKIKKLEQIVPGTEDIDGERNSSLVYQFVITNVKY